MNINSECIQQLTKFKIIVECSPIVCLACYELFALQIGNMSQGNCKITKEIFSNILPEQSEVNR